jgi:hypothetical protein
VRAIVLRGFCIAPLVHAEVGQVVDLSESLYREMLSRGTVAPAPADPAKAEPSAKSETKSSK